MGNEGFEPCCFLTKVPGGTNELLEFSDWNSANPIDRQSASLAEIGEGEFDIGPGGVLGEVCAHDHLELRRGGPPVLRSVGGEEGGVEGRDQRTKVGVRAGVTFGIRG